MKRTYQVTIDFPQGVPEEDWKVQNAIASAIESRIRQQGQHLKVKHIEKVNEEREPTIEDFINDLFGAFGK